MRAKTLVLLSLFSQAALWAATPESEQKEARMARDEARLEKVVAKYESPLDYGFDLSYSPRRFPNYRYTDTLTTTDAGHAINMGFEWLPITRYGKLGIGLGLGFSTHPNVVIVDADDDEVATLYTVPIEIALSYHFDFIQNQILVPYGKVGPSITLIKQSSNYGHTRSGLQNFTALELAAGVQLNLNPLETSAAREMDQSIGINASYLYAEYHITQAMGSTSLYDLSRNEFRFGLRFEL